MLDRARGAAIRIALLVAVMPVLVHGQQTHALEPTPKTVVWGYYDAQVPPVLRIHSGDRVQVHTLLGLEPDTVAAGGFEPDPMVREIYRTLTKGPGGHMLTGPIAIEEAEPGDVLEITFDSIALALPYAYNSFRPGRGFLPDDFPYARLKLIPLDRTRMVAHFAPGIDVPLKPFFGSIGVAPPQVLGRISSAPPWFHGGNLDNKELVAGSHLFLPVHVRGALLSLGDGHAGQGNGEVTLTALETSLTATLTVTVHKGHPLAWPRAETPTHYISMGMHEDLTEATKLAVRNMIAFLVEERHLSRDDAYMLCSIAGDLAITQLVDGTKGVHMMLPKAVFGPAR